jgi:hypothetical protein
MSHPERLDREPLLLRALFRGFLADYLRIVEKEASTELRLDRLVIRRKPVDGTGLVAETVSRSGERVTVLVQIESEALTPGAAARRIGRSLRLLRLPYGEPILASLVYLRGGRAGIHLAPAVLARVASIETARIYLTTFAPEAMRAEPYLERPEPLAWALAARMKQTRCTAEEHRRECLERIAGAALDEKRRALLRRSVEALRGEPIETSPGIPRCR